MFLDYDFLDANYGFPRSPTPLLGQLFGLLARNSASQLLVVLLLEKFAVIIPVWAVYSYSDKQTFARNEMRASPTVAFYAPVGHRTTSYFGHVIHIPGPELLSQNASDCVTY